MIMDLTTFNVSNPSPIAFAQSQGVLRAMSPLVNFTVLRVNSINGQQWYHFKYDECDLVPRYIVLTSEHDIPTVNQTLALRVQSSINDNDNVLIDFNFTDTTEGTNSWGVSIPPFIVPKGKYLSVYSGLDQSRGMYLYCQKALTEEVIYPQV